MRKVAIWQPMKTAPRDEVVDLWLKAGGRLSDQWWDEEDQSWTGIEEEAFSHWAPLPRFESEVIELELEDDRRWLIFVVTCLVLLGGATLWRILS